MNRIDLRPIKILFLNGTTAKYMPNPESFSGFWFYYHQYSVISKDIDGVRHTFYSFLVDDEEFTKLSMLS